MFGEINPLVLTRFELARCRMFRRSFEAFACADSKSLKIKIKQRVFAVQYGGMRGGRDDAPLPLWLDELCQLERKIDEPMAGRVFDISPRRRPSSAMLTPPV